ncbi:AcrR family transcriptional regulator [Streptomyces sp. CZ24]|uniref:TetR/AcrR family transcriptional regulator n=1 Tax=Streptomyces TaxID=1883 RepID=UPI001A40C97D|nr:MULTISPECIES: TetR/AcrR family transcriptional regulator [Streptomyces]MBL0777933.1 TetR/AcrR family transcriptional regulator [Streptomyces albidoflavus]MBL0802786.1 TetR/AcrR family transcriptional regulator [Streptomyces albidoflavus]MCR0990663.1 TetR/AcrR family transcriptional regulator [Streptomyces albidoflavus]MDH6187774.1 AcrR family transcriptional regulator [Streptomyces sp. CZ24]UDF08075.1 TetR/AcrR family transcriptional regulator [Streptomyces sp. WA1-19]
MSRYARTHETLRTAALEMFAAQGYDATTTAAVAERAGVSEMTLFRHFATKEALLLEDAFDPAVAAAVRARPPQEHPMRAAAEGIRTVWRQLPEDQVESVRERIRIIAGAKGLHGAIERNSRATVDALVGALCERGTARTEARVVASALVAGLSVALLDWAGGGTAEAVAPGAAGLRDVLDRVLDTLGGGR